MNEELKKETMTLPESVSVYEIDGTTYRVRTFFDLECKETLADIIDELIIQKLEETDKN